MKSTRRKIICGGASLSKPGFMTKFGRTSKSKKIVEKSKNMKLIIGLVLMFLIAVSGNAQITASMSGKADLQKLITVKKNVAVRPLPPNVKLNKVKVLMQGKVTTQTLSVSSLTAPTTLSVAAPVKDGNNFLKFNLPSQVSPNQNSAFFEPLGGNLPDNGVIVTFNAPASGYYVFDFSTQLYQTSPNSPVTMTFKGIFNPEFQEQKIYNDDGHTIFITKEVKAGPNFFFLGGSKATWNFYSVDISQFKTGN